MSGVLNVPVPLFFASPPISLGDLTSTRDLRWGPACGQLQVSSSPSLLSTKLTQATCLLAFSRLHWDSEFPK